MYFDEYNCRFRGQMIGYTLRILKLIIDILETTIIDLSANDRYMNKRPKTQIDPYSNT